MQFNQNRIYGLDILRATAIICVLYSHAYYKVSTHFNEKSYRSLLPDGVSLFFVLSGFLIGGILMKTINTTAFSFSELKQFWFKRWFRTMPAYFVILTILVVHHLATSGSPQHFSFYLKYFVFLQSLSDGMCYLYPESWSLCVEEWFYLLVPVYLFFLLRCTPLGTRKAVFITIVSTIITVTLIRVYKVNTHHYSTIKVWDTFLRKALITRLDSIMFGFLGAYAMYYHHSITKARNILFAFGLTLFLFLGVQSLFSFGWFYNYLQLSIESIATLLLIPKLLTVKTGRGLVFRLITFFSMISYSVYLINYTPYDQWAEPWLCRVFNILPGDNSAGTDIIRVILFLTWSLTGAYVLYHLVEKPMMRRRDMVNCLPSHKKKRSAVPTSFFTSILISLSCLSQCFFSNNI